MKGPWILGCVFLSVTAAAAVAVPVPVAGFGDQGWYSDDTRSDAGADLVGINYTHYGKPGQTPTAADDTAIAQQIQFVPGPAGATLGGAVLIDGTTGNSGKSTISVIDTTSGIAPASDLVGGGFSATYEWYMEPNPTVRTLAFRVGIQSTQWAASQAGFTAIRSGESAWDLVLVHTMDSPVANAWNTPTVDLNNGLWYLYGQAGNGNWVAIAGASPPAGTTGNTLAGWQADATWGPYLFGTGATITSVQLGLGSGQRQCRVYVDYLQTTLLNGGDVVDFVSPVHNVDSGEYFSTIQAAVDAASPGDTIEVAAGTYTETVTLTQSLNLIGAGCDQVTWRGSAVTSRSLHIRRDAGTPADIHVELAGFRFETENNQSVYAQWSPAYAEALTLDIHDNCFAHVNTRNPGMDFGVYVAGATQTARGAEGAIRIYDNEFDVVTGGVLCENCRAVDVIGNIFHTTYEGVTFNYYVTGGPYGEQYVACNEFTHIPVDWAFAMNNWHGGTGAYTVLPNVTTGNLVTATGFSYAIAYGVAATQSSTHDFTVLDNALLSGTILLWGDYAGEVLLNASGNWWGGNSAGHAAGRVSPNVDFTPWLDSGLDTSGDMGFQGDFSSLWVDDDSPQSGTAGRIQEGVDLADGSTVNVLPGEYVEQVVITTDDIELLGSGSGDDPLTDTIVRSPATLSYSFNTGSNDNYPVIGVDGATGVAIRDVRVDGDGRGGANYRFVGVAFWNAGGELEDCYITGVRNTPLSGAQHGVGVYASNNTGGPYTLDVLGTAVADYQKNGMALLGAGLTVDVQGCTATGAGPLGSGLPAQNGIQIGYGAGGVIDGCVVSDHIYTGGSWAATGVLVDTAGSLSLSNCELADNYPGVYWINASGSVDGVLLTNAHADSGDGLYLYNSTSKALGGKEPAFPLPSPLDGEATGGPDKAGIQLTITNSVFTGHAASGSWGVAAFATDSSPADINISGSKVTNWDSGLVAYDYGGPASITANYNQVVGNVTYGFENFFASVVMDAEYNYWGSGTGPTDAVGTDEAENPPCYDPSTMVNANGTGDAVTDGNVDYCPWLGAPATITLEPKAGDVCYAPGDSLVVEITLSDATDVIVGGQFYVTYDTSKLTLVSADPGDAPFTREILELQPAAGTLFYSVGVPNGDPGTAADTVMARLTFTVIGASGSACDVAGLVDFLPDSGGLQNKLSNDIGEAVLFEAVPLAGISIDNTAPVITCPADISVNADAGVCTAAVDPGAASAADNCDLTPVITWARSDNAGSLTDPYDSLDSPITITWTAEDDCGNSSQCVQTISVSAYNELVVDVELKGVFEAALTRCITFELWACPGPPVIVSEELTFLNGKALGATVLVPCGDYDCMTARDKLHTLRRTDLDDFGIVGTQYVADFTDQSGVSGDDDSLMGGNLNDDFYIDILDFGVFTWKWNTNYGTGDTTCSTPYPHADISGNGKVFTEEFTFIQTGFLAEHEANCCGQPGKNLPAGAEGPMTRVSVAELRLRGLGYLGVADLNGDGWLDTDDVTAFRLGERPKPVPVSLDPGAAEIPSSAESVPLDLTPSHSADGRR